MTTMNVSIPTELKREMEKYKDVDWSAIARIAFQRKLDDLRFLKEFTSDSEITDEDAERLGRDITSELARHY